MVISEANVHNIMGGMESAGGVRLHNHKRKLKQRFSIIKKLGQGTYGKVQLGINKETGQEVAIKTIKKCKIETEADLVRIRREIQIMSSVHHPNIIHIYEVFENREKMVLVMEYAAGGELYDYLSEHKVLTEVEARRIFRQISTAIFYCHKHKICHRDLKLENILLDQNGNAKIADFGLSNVFNEQGLLSTFCGSPLYASPEIVNGTPYLGPEVDCWSLGVLLYTLVYGAMPFDGTNFKHLVKQITYSDYFEPKQPSRASPLIKDMLTVSPAQRADIERICSHWWVNEGYEQSCLYIAENLAAQTPVRLDLLLSLVPEHANANQLLVKQEQVEPTTNETIFDNKLADAVIPSRCYSEDRLMQVDKMGGWTLPKVNQDKKVENPHSDILHKIDNSVEKINSTKYEQEKVPSKVDNDARRPRPYKKASKNHSAPICGSIIDKSTNSDEKLYASVPVKIFREKVISDTKNKILDSEDTRKAIKLDDSSDKSLRKLQNNDTISTKTEFDQQNHHIDQEILSNTDTKEIVNSATIVPSASRKQFLQLTDSNKLSLKSQHTMKTEEESPKLAEKVQVVDKQNAEKKNLSPEKVKAPKKLRTKALSLDSEMATKIEPIIIHKPPTERRRSKIFETAEKFNQLLSTSSTESEKPVKKLFIPGVNVEGAKAAFERKASLSSSTIPQTLKPAVTKIIIDVPQIDNKIDNSNADDHVYNREEEKRRAVNIITGALGKPPMQRKYSAGSLATSIQTSDSKILKSEEFKIPIVSAEGSSRLINKSLSTDKKFQLESNATDVLGSSSASEATDKLTKFSTEPSNLKSATLPRLRKTSKAKITLSNISNPDLVPHIRTSFDTGLKINQHQSPKHRSEMFLPINSHSAQSVNTSKSISSSGPEPIRKSPREFIIPISMEDRTYVNSHNDDVKSERMPKNQGHNRILRSHQVNTLLSDASKDESSVFPGFSKKNDEFLQNHLHRLRSSRPRYTLEHEDSLSSGEDDDDDGFEFLTAENLFSTLLSRVRNLTQRLNINDNPNDSIFPSTRLLSRIGSNSSQDFWNRNTEDKLFRPSVSSDKFGFQNNDESEDSMVDLNMTNLAELISPRKNLYKDEIGIVSKAKKRQSTSESQAKPEQTHWLSQQLIEQIRCKLPRSLSLPLDLNLRDSLFKREQSTKSKYLLFEWMPKRLLDKLLITSKCNIRKFCDHRFSISLPTLCHPFFESLTSNAHRKISKEIDSFSPKSNTIPSTTLKNYLFKNLDFNRHSCRRNITNEQKLFKKNIRKLLKLGYRHGAHLGLLTRSKSQDCPGTKLSNQSSEIISHTLRSRSLNDISTKITINFPSYFPHLNTSGNTNGQQVQKRNGKKVSECGPLKSCLKRPKAYSYLKQPRIKNKDKITIPEKAGSSDNQINSKMPVQELKDPQLSINQIHHPHSNIKKIVNEARKSIGISSNQPCLEPTKSEIKYNPKISEVVSNESHKFTLNKSIDSNQNTLSTSIDGFNKYDTNGQTLTISKPVNNPEKKGSKKIVMDQCQRCKKRLIESNIKTEDKNKQAHIIIEKNKRDLTSTSKMKPDLLPELIVEKAVSTEGKPKAVELLQVSINKNEARKTNSKLSKIPIYNFQSIVKPKNLSNGKTEHVENYSFDNSIMKSRRNNCPLDEYEKMETEFVDFRFKKMEINNKILKPSKSISPDDEKKSQIVAPSQPRSKELRSNRESFESTEDLRSFESPSVSSTNTYQSANGLSLSQASPSYSVCCNDRRVADTVTDRIHRKSFYTRFNDRKKNVLVSTNNPRTNSSLSLTMPQKLTLYTLREDNRQFEGRSTNNLPLTNRKIYDKIYSAPNNEIQVRRRSAERKRYSDEEKVSSYSTNNVLTAPIPYGRFSMSYNPQRKYLFNMSTSHRGLF